MRTAATLLLAGLLLGAGPLAAGEMHETGPLDAGARVLIPIDTAPGDYLRGEVHVGAGRFDLDLTTADGRPLRRLASDAEGQAGFQFMAGAAPLRLSLTAVAAGRARLELLARIPVAQQSEPQYLAPDPAAGQAPPLSPWIAAAAERIAGGAANAVWDEAVRRGTPLVEPGPDGQAIVTFLARGARRNVRLFGGPSGDHEWMDRLAGSDIWFRSFVVPADTRLSYRLAPDVPDIPGPPRERRMAILATAAADPLNRAPWPADAPDAFNQDSTLELPGAPEQPGLAPASHAPRGTLAEHRLASARLGNTRGITLYTPPGFDPDDPRNLLLFVFDARAYLTKVPTPALLDALVAAGRLPPVIAVFVSEIDGATRDRELPGNRDFADFMADELLPFVRARTGARVPAARTILAGSSYGGLAAATIALRHPERFGNAIALSGSFWWLSAGEPPQSVADQVARGPRKPVRFHLAAGLFETAHAGAPGILETSRHLRDVLKAKGYDASYREYAGGHDYLVWRGALADALLALAPRL